MVSNKKKVFLVFDNTRDTILAERECIKNGYKCTAVPSLGHCGILLEIPGDQEEEVIAFLKKQKKPFKYFGGEDF